MSRAPGTKRRACTADPRARVPPAPTRQHARAPAERGRDDVLVDLLDDLWRTDVVVQQLHDLRPDQREQLRVRHDASPDHHPLGG